MVEKIRNFRDLDVWKKGMEIIKDVCGVTSTFPKQELSGLSSQMRRSSVSVPSNTAEGFNRLHNKEYKQFPYVALGSCAERETLVEIAADMKYLNEQRKAALSEKLDHESRMLHN